MIQRNQTIYLFLAALCSGGLIFLFPTFTKDGQLTMAKDDPTFLIMFLLSAALSLFALTRFKNRKLQVVLGRLNVILNFVLFAGLLYTYFVQYKDAGGSVGLAIFIPIAAVVLISLANRAIMGDEALVKAADRLR